MNEKYRENSNGKTNQHEGSFHMALAWIAALSASIAAWAGIS